jgi:hypothetical protein
VGIYVDFESPPDSSAFQLMRVEVERLVSLVPAFSYVPKAPVVVLVIWPNAGEPGFVAGGALCGMIAGL